MERADFVCFYNVPIMQDKVWSEAVDRLVGAITDGYDKRVCSDKKLEETAG
jgi:hypothetical protein